MRGQRNDLDQSNEGIINRIKSKCKITESGCWEWQGVTTNKNRPTCSVKGKQGLVYRHIYEATYNKQLTPETYLCHTCDNPICCNPEHLFEGDNTINQLDYKTKHKAKIGLRPEKTCPTNLSDKDRLLWYKDHAVKINNKGCWLWQRETGKDGYGRVRYKNVKHATHKLFWALHNNKVSELDNLRNDGLVFRHLCNNKKCCNPKHIKPGTRSENALDSVIYTYNEPIIEWLFIYEFCINEGYTNRNGVIRGLRDLGLVSENIKDSYIKNVLRGKSHKHLHKEFFDWTPTWR